MTFNNGNFGSMEPCKPEEKEMFYVISKAVEAIASDG